VEGKDKAEKNQLTLYCGVKNEEDRDEERGERKDSHIDFRSKF
jgi:hypothetical protein